MTKYPFSRSGALLALTLSLAAAPALADPLSAAIDASVHESEAQLSKALASGDPVEIANARAKLKAAQAAAWGQRNPAPQPSPSPQMASARPR